MTESCPDIAGRLVLEAERLLEARDLAAALRTLDAAERAGADPDRCDAGRWTAQMLLGNFAGAWAASDRIRARGGLDEHRFWQGECVAGRRVIVRCLHGLGDSVQFLRFLPRLAREAESVVVEVPPAMVEIAPLLAGMEHCGLVTWGEGAPEIRPEWDVQVEVTELPYLFRVEVGDLPWAERYVRPPAGAGVMGRGVEMRGLRVGMVWAAGEWNVARSLPWEMVQELVCNSACAFWNLQGGQERDRWRELPAEVLRGSREIGDGLRALVAAVAEVDLVITVDTLAAHLAGAMGVPCWLMLQHAADWRWMTGREDSPWYPSLRLFRQPSPGDWASVVRRVAEELGALRSEDTE